MLATMYVNDRYKEQRKRAGIRSKHDKIIVLFASLDVLRGSLYLSRETRHEIPVAC